MSIDVDEGHERIRRPYLRPFAFLQSAIRHRSLILRLTKRQIRSRYVGSVLGLVWAVLNPLFMLTVYTFVFSVVLQVRWGTEVENRGYFALILFSGLLAFNIFQLCLTQSPLLMLANPSFVKKVVFPLEILPWVLMAMALFDFAVGSCVFFVAYFIILGVPPLTIVLLPTLILPLCLFCMGIMWFLSSVGVYLRDLGQLMSVVALLMLFMCPIFYPFEMVPEQYRNFLLANPMTIIIIEMRNLIFEGVLPSWQMLIPAFVVGWVTAWLGYVWFMVTKKGFGDVV